MNIEHQIYIANQLRHSSYKKFENYVISQIYWTLVNKGIELKLITQQTVFREDAVNHVAYMDGYFPALNIELEVDEPYHLGQKAADSKRESDIMFQMGALKLTVDPMILRVDCTKDIDAQVKDITAKVISRYEECGRPQWIDEDIVQKVKLAGKISFNDNIIFHYKSDVLNAIGHKSAAGKEYPKSGTQRLTTITTADGAQIWFPVMNGNYDYINKYDLVNDIFYTSAALDKADKLEAWIWAKKAWKEGKMTDKYVFMKVKDSFNNIGYKYFGRFHAESYDPTTETFTWKCISKDDLPCVSK